MNIHVLTQPSSHPFGLDISDLSLKLVQLKEKRHAVNIQTLSKISVPKGYIIDGRIKNKEGVIELIKQLKNNTIFGKVTTKEVSACLPEPKTFIKLVEIPREKDEKFNEILINEIQKNIPLDLNNANYDWQVVSKDKISQKVLIGVIEKKIADEYYDLLKSSDLDPVALEIEAIAITRALLPPHYNSKKTIIIIDIGAKRSSLIAYNGHTILFTISLPISGHTTTHTISKNLNIDHSKAETAKIVCGLNTDMANGAISKILTEKIKKLTNKTKQAIKYLEEHYPQFSEVEKIYLTGGGSNIKNLSAIMTENLNIKTIPGKVFLNLKINPKTEKKFMHEEFATLKKIAHNHKIEQNFSAQFTTAVGLALRGVHIDDL